MEVHDHATSHPKLSFSLGHARTSSAEEHVLPIGIIIALRIYLITSSTSQTPGLYAAPASFPAVLGFGLFF